MMILSGLMMICTFDYWQNVGPLQEMALFKCPIWHNMTRGKSMNNSHPKGCVKRGKSVFRLKLHLICPISYVSHQTNILVCYFTFLFDFSHSDSYIFLQVQMQHIVKMKQVLCVILKGMSWKVLMRMVFRVITLWSTPRKTLSLHKKERPNLLLYEGTKIVLTTR